MIDRIRYEIRNHPHRVIRSTLPCGRTRVEAANAALTLEDGKEWWQWPPSAAKTQGMIDSKALSRAAKAAARAGHDQRFPCAILGHGHVIGAHGHRIIRAWHDTEHPSFTPLVVEASDLIEMCDAATALDVVDNAITAHAPGLGTLALPCAEAHGGYLSVLRQVEGLEPDSYRATMTRQECAAAQPDADGGIIIDVAGPRVRVRAKPSPGCVRVSKRYLSDALPSRGEGHVSLIPGMDMMLYVRNGATETWIAMMRGPR
jgi:hypothetical protein